MRAGTGLLLLSFTILLPSIGCRTPTRTTFADGGSDLRAGADLSAPPDLRVARDLTAPVDLTTDEPDLPPGACSIVGSWDVGQGFIVTMDARGALLLMGMAIGNYTFVGKTLSITDGSSPDCMMAGKYTITFGRGCATATAAEVTEPCADRGMALTAGPWTRQ